MDVGGRLVAWAIPTGIDAYPEPTGGCGGPCSLPQVAQGTVIGFVRTDPQLDAPLGGGVEVAYDLAPWNFSAGFSAFQPGACASRSSGASSSRWSDDVPAQG